MNRKNQLGTFIQDTRERRALSQYELAQLIGVTRGVVGHIETGRQAWVGAEMFNSLARALEVPVTDLLRAGGIELPSGRNDQIAWLVSQLDDEGLEYLADLGRALLRRHLRPLTPEE